MLTFQHTVEHCIIHFVALEVIMEIPKIYVESFTDKSLAGVVHNSITIEKKGKEISFFDRSLYHKVARFTYKLSRAFYVSLIFYFVPFMTIFINFMIAEVGHHGHGGHGESAHGSSSHEATASAGAH